MDQHASNTMHVASALISRNERSVGHPSPLKALFRAHRDVPDSLVVFHQNRPLRASRRLSSPRGIRVRHFYSKLYLWAVGGGRRKNYMCKLVGRSRQRPEQSGVDEPRRAENLYAPAVDPVSARGVAPLPLARACCVRAEQARHWQEGLGLLCSSVLCVRLRDESKESTRVDARPRDTAATEQWDPRRQVGRFPYHIAALLLS